MTDGAVVMEGAKPAHLGNGRIVLYNMAGFSFNLYDAVLYAWLPFFYCPPEGIGRAGYISLAAIGAILAGGRILDAVTDFLIGYWSDRARTRWGRRKPFIFLSAPILFISFVLVWTPPVEGVNTANAAYLAAILFVYYWAYTGMLIPWFAVLPEMSDENRVRVKIVVIGVVLGAFGSMVGGGLSGWLFESMGAFKMALFMGVLGLVSSELTLLGIHEKPRMAPDEEQPGFFRVMKEVFSDRQVLSFAAMITFVQMTYQLMFMNTPYLTTLILGRKAADASILMGEVILFTALSVPLWYRLLSKYPKRSVFRGIITCMVFGFILAFFIGKVSFGSPLVQAMVVFPLVAIPVGGMFAASLGIIADLTDYDELKTGRRREAVYYGIYGIVRKTGWALCSLILSGVFSAFGYSKENPAGVQVIWLVCSGACLIGLLLYIPYKLGDSKQETKRIMGL